MSNSIFDATIIAMLLSFAATKLGTAVLLIVGSIMAWAENSYHETLLNDEVSTLSILTADTFIFFMILLVWMLSSRARRKRLVEDFAKFTLRHWFGFLSFAFAGLLAAYAADVSLVKHGADTMSLASVIIGVGVTSGIYMLSVERDAAVKSAPWLIGLIFCSIGLATSRQ